MLLPCPFQTDLTTGALFILFVHLLIHIVCFSFIHYLVIFFHIHTVLKIRLVSMTRSNIMSFFNNIRIKGYIKYLLVAKVRLQKWRTGITFYMEINACSFHFPTSA